VYRGPELSVPAFEHGVPHVDFAKGVVIAPYHMPKM